MIENENVKESKNLKEDVLVNQSSSIVFESRVEPPWV